MSGDRFVQDSIEDTLLALATGIREAQEALNETPPLDAYGRPLPTYHVPYLDFEITARIETLKQPDGRTIFSLRLPRIGQAGTAGKDAQELTSKLSGRFVAIPPNEGLPMVRLRITMEVVDYDERRLSVQLSNSAGELLTGQRVEVNIDPGASQLLSKASGADFERPQAGTLLTEAVLVTGADGSASTLLKLDPREPDKGIIVVTALAGPAKASLSVPVEGAT